MSIASTPELAPRTETMNRIRVSALLFAPVLCLAASCSQADIAVLPKDRIQKKSATVLASRERADHAALVRPSGSLVSAASGKARDRHNMPVYSFAERTRLVRTTAYTCSEDDHIAYGSKNATGTALRYTGKVRSAAADWSYYPVGTVFRIKGLPYTYVVDDYGSALTGTGTIDLYKPNKETMNLWGLRNVEISVVQWGSFSRSARILSERTRFSHCRQMLANIVRQDPRLSAVATR